MSKKRVHEIAKELKNNGIELDNKEVVTELVSLGYDVKSHSSSLEDDQATAAVQKILDKRKPRAAPPPVAAKGFVVRRKGPEAEAPMSAPPAYAPQESAPAHVPAHEEEAAPVAAEAEAEAPQETQAPAEVPVEAAAPEAPARPDTVPEVTATQASSVPVETAPIAPPPEVTQASPQAAPEAVIPPPAAPQQRTVVDLRRSLPPPQASQPMAPPPGLRRPGSPSQVMSRPSNRPGFTPAQVISRPNLARPGTTARPPGAPGAAPGAPAAGGPPQDPRTLRPTATQAVVLSRPLVAVRRVTPSSTAHRTIPLAPGRKAIGEVREFKVVPDHLGRGRELVDITKNKENAQRGKKRPDGKDGVINQQEIKDLAWGRVNIPLRGKKKKPTKKGQKTLITTMAEDKKVIRLEEGISVSDLSQRMGVKTGELIKKLMAGGTMATVNQMLDLDTAGVIATDYGWKVEKVGFEVEDHIPEQESLPENVKHRPPVVTVMGHVDHGKTSLLDAIRQADVASGEAGGITQHIGAYTVKTSRGDITFLDTPGHEAFTSMRARGANVTDLVVLVVASDDGVMPTTIEAINHAKAAEVPIVVAINKMDLAGANPDRVKKDLSANGLVPEEWGGDTIIVPVSARTKVGLDLLLENISLQAEVLELKADTSKPAVGTIVEAKLEKGRGPVATVLVSEGTLKLGDAIVTGTHSGKVRLMVNSRGEKLQELLPGYCAEVVGLSGVPSAGDTLNAVEDDRAAKEIAEHRMAKERKADLGKTSKDSLDALFARVKEGEFKQLRLVIKADVQGSSEAVTQAVNKLSTPKVKVDVISKGVGAISESDVMLAAASKGIVLGFNVKPESGAEVAAKHQGVVIQMYSIIYELIDGVRNAMEGLLEPIRTEKRLGRAEVRNLFNVPKLGTIAGVSVIDGVMKRSAIVRLMRESTQVHVGKLTSLKRFKDDVREVQTGFECGIGVENFNDFKAGDIIEAFEIEESRPSLS